MASKASTRASANKPSSTPAQSSLADAPLLTYKPPTPSQLQSQQNSKERNIKKKRKAKVAVTQDVQVAVANVGLPSSSSSLPDFKQTALDFVKHQANSNTASQTSKVSLTSSSGDSQLAALSSPAILGSTTPAAIAKISSTSIGLSSPNPVPVRTKKKRKKPLAPISTVEPVPDIQEQVTTRELQAAFRRRDVWEGIEEAIQLQEDALPLFAGGAEFEYPAFPPPEYDSDPDLAPQSRAPTQEFTSRCFRTCSEYYLEHVIVENIPLRSNLDEPAAVEWFRDADLSLSSRIARWQTRDRRSGLSAGAVHSDILAKAKDEPLLHGRVADFPKTDSGSMLVISELTSENTILPARPKWTSVTLRLHPNPSTVEHRAVATHSSVTSPSFNDQKPNDRSSNIIPTVALPTTADSPAETKGLAADYSRRAEGRRHSALLVRPLSLHRKPAFLPAARRWALAAQAFKQVRPDMDVEKSTISEQIEVPAEPIRDHAQLSEKQLGKLRAYDQDLSWDESTLSIPSNQQAFRALTSTSFENQPLSLNATAKTTSFSNRSSFSSSQASETGSDSSSDFQDVPILQTEAILTRSNARRRLTPIPPSFALNTAKLAVASAATSSESPGPIHSDLTRSHQRSKSQEWRYARYFADAPSTASDTGTGSTMATIIESTPRSVQGVTFLPSTPRQKTTEPANIPASIAIPSATNSSTNQDQDLMTGYTDFDVLLTRLDGSANDGQHYEDFLTVQEILGSGKPSRSITDRDWESLHVAAIEIESRRVDRDGRVKLKFSCGGLRVTKCNICLAQYKAHEWACIFPQCLHCFHKGCMVKWLARSSNCPSCRQPLG